MGKRKREDEGEDDYVAFCSGLQKTSADGIGDQSYIYTRHRLYKRPKINPNVYKEPTVRYTRVEENNKMYTKISNLITNKTLVIDNLIRVNNSVLEKAYNAKLKQKMREYGHQVEEALLFHGTKESNLDSICKYNFDWRLTGHNVGHKYGKGVCFSKNAKYASTYSETDKYYKVMIVAKVLIGRVCEGSHDMSIPPKGFDTSRKRGSDVVLVKYEDNEFYPAYIMYYHFEDNQRYWNNNYYYQYNQNNYCDYNYYNKGYNFNQYYNQHKNCGGFNFKFGTDANTQQYSYNENYYQNNQNYYYKFGSNNAHHDFYNSNDYSTGNSFGDYSDGDYYKNDNYYSFNHY